MKKKSEPFLSVRTLTVTALLTAMNVLMSMSVFSIPVPGGHLYLCDAVICTAALLLDPLPAFMVGGIGSFVGDFLFYPAPMFVSLITHGLQATVISLLARHCLTHRPLLSRIIAVTAGGVIMVIGYTFGRAFVYSTMEASLLKLPYEILQAALGGAVGVTLSGRFEKLIQKR